MQYIARMMMGRLTDGAQRDHGVRIHATLPHVAASYCRGKALCGAEPGRRSCGWSPPEERPVNCPTCLKRIEQRKVRAARKFRELMDQGKHGDCDCSSCLGPNY